MAKMAGAEVVVCASSESKMAKLKSLGADHAMTYMDNEFHKGVYGLYGKPGRRGFEGGVTMAVNFTGGDTWVPSLRSLKRGGRLLTCGATAGFDPKTDIRFIWTFELKLLGSNSWERDDLEHLMQYISDGKMVTGNSLYKDKLNEKIASSKLSIHSQPLSDAIADGYFITSDGYVAENSIILDSKKIYKTTNVSAITVEDVITAAKQFVNF